MITEHEDKTVALTLLAVVGDGIVLGDSDGGMIPITFSAPIFVDLDGNNILKMARREPSNLFNEPTMIVHDIPFQRITIVDVDGNKQISLGIGYDTETQSWFVDKNGREPVDSFFKFIAGTWEEHGEKIEQ